MSTQSEQSVRIRTASFDDYPAIADLMRVYRLETKSPEEWKHLWQGNPEYARFGDDWPIGWVLEDARNQIVGYFGNIPIAYEFQGKHLTAAATHAWVVDAAHRRSTILLVHRYFSQKNVDLFINASANYEAGRIFQAMHGHMTPSPRSDIALFWITDHPQFGLSLLKRRGIDNVWMGHYLLGGLMWGVSQVRQHWQKLNGSTNSAKMHIQVIHEFDERFDDLWQRLRSTPGLLWCVRDRQTLAWHFKYPLRRGEAWILVASEGSTVCAYSIFLRQDNNAFGLKRARLVDFQAVPGAEHALGSMISLARMRCRKEGVHMLETVGFGGPTRDLLELQTPYRRTLPAWMFFYKATSKQLDQDLSRAERWDVCSYDGDGSL